MVERPKNVVLAVTAAWVGAFFVFMATVVGLDIAADGFGIKIGFCMLSLILFIAVAGSLTKNGQWSWRFLIFMEVLCTATPILAFMFDAMDFAFTLAILILGGVMIVFTTPEDTKRWIESDRI